MSIPTYISNYKAVTDLYDHWPSFHDANVTTYEISNNTISFTLHTWQMTKEIDEKGYFGSKNHALITFNFKDIFDVKMDSFAAKNILFEMSLTPKSDLSSFCVELDSVMDMSGSFSAHFGELVSVKPCTPEGK